MGGLIEQPRHPPINIYFNEHLGDARLCKPDTVLGDHNFECHTEIDSKEINTNYRIKIFTTKEHEADLRISEDIYIRDNSQMNTKSRSWNLARYMM